MDHVVAHHGGGGGAFPQSVGIDPVSLGQGAQQALVVGKPLELLLGRVDPDQIMAGFAVGLSWLVLLTAVQQVLWRRGILRYQAVGG